LAKGNQGNLAAFHIGLSQHHFDRTFGFGQTGQSRRSRCIDGEYGQAFTALFVMTHAQV